MKIALLPPNEVARQKDLESYDILDTAPETDFDDLVELAGQVCKCPISLVTLLDNDRQWFKANQGLDVGETPRDVSFCSHAILQDEVFIVEDATKDERFFDNPLVTDGPHIRFYAGAPIVSPAGNKLGTLCIIDDKPKKLSLEEQRGLLLLSRQVTKLLEIRQKNALLRTRAHEIITLKSRAINKVIEDHERDKKSIAVDLHEDFAQSIASSMMYLNMAEMDESERLSHVLTAREQLSETLVNMRKLSYRITPVTMNWLNAADTITEFIDRTTITYPFSVSVESEQENETANGDCTLAAIRVIEQWLKILSERNGIDWVRITVPASDQFEIVVEDNDRNPLLADREYVLYESAIYDKIESYGGEVKVSVAAGANSLRIVLPCKNETIKKYNAFEKLTIAV